MWVSHDATKCPQPEINTVKKISFNLHMGCYSPWQRGRGLLVKIYMSKPFNCHKCDEIFPEPDSLKTHMLTGWRCRLYIMSPNHPGLQTWNNELNKSQFVMFGNVVTHIDWTVEYLRTKYTIRRWLATSSWPENIKFTMFRNGLTNHGWTIEFFGA